MIVHTYSHTYAINIHTTNTDYILTISCRNSPINHVHLFLVLFKMLKLKQSLITALVPWLLITMGTMVITMATQSSQWQQGHHHGNRVITMETQFPSLLKHMVSLGVWKYNLITSWVCPFMHVGITLMQLKYRALLTWGYTNIKHIIDQFLRLQAPW